MTDVVREYYGTRDDGVKLYKSYSDKGVYIQKDGTEEIYDCAIDLEWFEYKYNETEELIVKEE